VSQYIIGKNIAIYCNNRKYYFKKQKYIIIIPKAIAI
jgi:hypothetical protein